MSGELVGSVAGDRSTKKLISPMQTLSSCSRTIAFVPIRHPLTNVPFLLPELAESKRVLVQQQNAVVPADEVAVDSEITVFRAPDQELSGKSDGLSR